MARLPKYAFKQDILYLRPKPSAPADESSPWYGQAAVGKNTLSVMVKEMRVEAGIGGKTNHSLCATGASAMFQGNVPEKIIQKTIGHRSTEAFRSYERACTEQEKALSKVLMTNTSFENESGQNSTATLKQQNLQVVTHTCGTAHSINRFLEI